MPEADEWRGLKSLVRVDRERIMGDKTTHERVYYISSLSPENPELIASIARRHWEVESLHWRLDVVFRQDKSRYRDRNGARNLAAIRKVVLNALSKETLIKRGLATGQCAAAFNPDYRENVLKKFVLVSCALGFNDFAIA